jgi:hypothetical protein
MRRTNPSTDPARCSATAKAASLADGIITAASRSPSGKTSPAFRKTCDPPCAAARAETVTGSESACLPACTCSSASRTVIIFVMDAGGHCRSASRDASAVPVSGATT